MQGQFVGLDNYRKLVFDSDFFHSVRLTLLFLLISIPIEFVLGLALAVLLSYHLWLKWIVSFLLILGAVGFAFWK